ncbi:TIGR02466 family protein [Bdellovibrio sp. HCB337]|uniref:TIGR02466 family protein n=1 Tax=Bdellovibrio sp. HCB337 TaxID=3394358 RepID=UPI0039A6965A
MIKNLFPSPIYYAPLASRGLKKLNGELLEESLKFSQIDDAGIEWSEQNYRGGYTSYGSIAHLHQVSTTFEDLKTHIDKHVRQYIKYLEMDVDPKQIQMRTCWINIMPAGAFHTMHIHPLSVISGTYYVQTPKNCSSIKFEDPRMVGFMASPPRKTKAQERNQHFVELKPQAGNLVLFESWMRHEVPQNLSDTERISISFNYDWM